jgi:hypothetical protein
MHIKDDVRASIRNTYFIPLQPAKEKQVGNSCTIFLEDILSGLRKSQASCAARQKTRLHIYFLFAYNLRWKKCFAPQS